MSSEEKNIDRIFRERLRNFDAEPPVEVWDGIKENLYFQRRKRTIFRISRIAAGIAIITALSVTYFIVRNPDRDDQISGNKELTGAQSEEGVKDRENKGELKTANIAVNPMDPETETGIYIGDFVPPTEKTEEKNYIADYPSGNLFNTGVTGRSIDQLDYKYPGTDVMLSRSEMPETRAEKYISSEENLPEDLYAMDIPDDVKNQFSRWAVGTEVSPLYSYRNLETQNEAMSLANDLNQAESGTLAYSGGVNVNFSPLRRLSVQSGLYYSRYGVNVDNAYVFEDATIEISSSSRFYSINYSSGVIETEDDMVDYVTNRGDHKYYSGITPNMDPMSLDFSSGEIVQNFEYLEVPLILRYKVIDRKIGFNLLGGLSTNLLVGSNTYYHSDGDREKIGETTEIKPFNYSSIVGLGLEYSVSKHLNLSLEPTFRYYLSSINQSSIIRSYPYSIGVFTGLRYSF